MAEIALQRSLRVDDSHIHAARNFDKLYILHPRRWVIGILLTYLILASNYALVTPAWQAPDEPAHYNYVAFIAENLALPVMQPGDYNQRARDRLVNSGFPPGAAIDSFRYEAYQPPLYYLLSVPIFWLSDSLPILRLWNVVIGLCVLVLLYSALELVFAGKPLITVSATAFAAFLPMHVAVLAAMNNDVLAELWIMASLFLLLRWMHSAFYEPAYLAAQGQRLLIGLGIVLGLGLLTKIYAYALTPICALTIIVVVCYRLKRPLLAGIRAALWALVPALLIGLPWWIRNWWVYGAWDFLGTQRHDQIVIDQPSSLSWLADNCCEAYLERALSYTFRSFWGVFGWLGVFLDERIYMALLLFSGVLFLGILWALVRLISGGPDMDMDDLQLWTLGLFAVILAAGAAGYVWYNLKFVQHQGRYFFWVLLPISTFVALGWREVLRPLQGIITGILTSVLALSFLFVGYVTGSMQKWAVLNAALMALFLLCQPLLLMDVGKHMTNRSSIWMNRLLELMRRFVWATPFALLALLNLVTPMLYILPQLSR